MSAGVILPLRTSALEITTSFYRAYLVDCLFSFMSPSCLSKLSWGIVPPGIWFSSVGFGFYFPCWQEEETPLHCAAWHGYYSVAKALCEAGCNVNIKNKEGETPLLTASARGYHDIVECLAEHRADLRATDKVSLSCFWSGITSRDHRCQSHVSELLHLNAASQHCFSDVGFLSSSCRDYWWQQ